MNEPSLEGKALQKEICEDLLRLECCYRCSIRYLGMNNFIQQDYENPTVTLQKLGLDVEVKKVNENSSGKRFKSNFCKVCLNIFEDSTITTLLKTEDIEQISKYDSTTFYMSLTCPKACMLRDYAMSLYLHGKFKDYYKALTVESLSKIWRRSFQNVIQSMLNKIYSENLDENLEVQFHYEYPLDDDECKSALRLNGHRRCDTSRSFIIEHLKDASSDVFNECFPIPPSTPIEGITNIKMICRHDTIYYAARYCKYARNIGQTPWIKDGTQIYTSVQEIIFKELIPVLNCAEIVFTTSGREDCDVRMLGRGRPFIVKVIDPKSTKLTFEQCRDIERKIALSGKVRIRDFQRVSKSSLDNIKKGEETKKKTYQIRCFIPNCDNIDKYLTIINGINDLSIKQKTPIRVLHRRTNSVRIKMIYSVQAEIESNGPPGYILINITSQAGTYIKEFIHGDFGRTNPSLGDLLNDTVEFVSLDVTEIDLDFPPSISNSNK